MPHFLQVSKPMPWTQYFPFQVHLRITLVLSGIVFSMVSSKFPISKSEEYFNHQSDISNLEAASLISRQQIVLPPPKPKAPKKKKKKVLGTLGTLEALGALGTKNDVEAEQPYSPPPRILRPDLICLDKQEGGAKPLQNVSVSCIGFMCLYVYNVSSLSIPDIKGQRRPKRSEDEPPLLASLVGKEDSEEVRPYLAPPRILKTLICPDGSGTIALTGKSDEEVNIVRMFLPPVNQIVALCLVLFALIKVLYFSTELLSVESGMEEIGVLDSFSSFQERKLNTAGTRHGFNYNLDHYQNHGNTAGRFLKKYRRRKRSDEEVAAGEVIPEEYLEYSEETIQVWNLVARSWNTIARGWNRVAMSWNVIAIPWNVLAIVWNLALTWWSILITLPDIFNVQTW